MSLDADRLVCRKATCQESNGRRKGGPTNNLELHRLSFKFNGADLEVNTNGTDVALGIGVVGETEEETRLGGPN